MNCFNWKRIIEKLRPKNKNDSIIFLLIGVLLLIIAVPVDSKDKEKETVDVQKTQNSTEQFDYIRTEEKKLEAMLGHMEGVGKVEVMITPKDDGLTVVDKDSRESESAKESTTVIYDRKDEKTPYVVSRKSPKIEGVLVVAEGGGNAKINADISEAVLALFDVEVHKIKIVKMSVQEESK